MIILVTEVWTAEDLDSVRNDLTGDYIQMADIDLGSYLNWQPIGYISGNNSGSGFTGSYNGNGYSISNLTINNEVVFRNTGLFWQLWEPGTLENIHLKNVTITTFRRTGSLVYYVDYTDDGEPLVRNCSVEGGTITVSGAEVGGLIGVSGSIVEDCYASVDIIIQSPGDYVGGLIGWSNGLRRCSSGGSISGTGGGYGGLVGTNYGWADHNTDISQCFSTTNLDISGWGWTGGLVGWSDSGAHIINSYARGNVHCEDNTEGVAGLVGWLSAGSKVTNSYSAGSVSGTVGTVGGLVGSATDEGAVINSYYDTEISGQSDTGKGEPRTTEQMTYPNAVNTYETWDFETVWSHDKAYTVNDGYPTLGEGSEIPTLDGPIPISNATELNNIRYEAANLFGVGTQWEGYYIAGSNNEYFQTNDIDLSGYVNWEGIGLDNISYDGGNFLISNMTIDRPDDAHQGLFSYCENSSFRNIRLDNVSLVARTESGGIVGCLNNYIDPVIPAVDNCHVTNIDMDITGIGYSGMIAGVVYDVGFLDCTAEGTLIANDRRPLVWTHNSGMRGCWHIGGIVGASFSLYSSLGAISIENCHVTGDIYGNSCHGGIVGGFYFYLEDESHPIARIYDCSYSGNLYMSPNYIDNPTVRDPDTGTISGYNRRQPRVQHGGIVGFVQGGIIEGCSSSGTLDTDFEFVDYSGGIFGQGNSSIIDCSSSMNVYTGWGMAGGIAGFCEGNNHTISIERCYSTGNVDSNRNNPTTYSTNRYVGGLIGYLGTFRVSRVKDCYSRSNVNGVGYVGGLVGSYDYHSNWIGYDFELQNCYSTGNVVGVNNVGGLLGYKPSDGIVLNSYYDMETSGQSDDEGRGDLRTTVQMTYPPSADTYVDWDFDEVWRHDQSYVLNDGYPLFQRSVVRVDIDIDLISSLPILVSGHRIALYRKVNTYLSKILFSSNTPRPDLVEDGIRWKITTEKRRMNIERFE